MILIKQRGDCDVNRFATDSPIAYQAPRGQSLYGSRKIRCRTAATSGIITTSGLKISLQDDLTGKVVNFNVVNMRYWSDCHRKGSVNQFNSEISGLCHHRTDWGTICENCIKHAGSEIVS